MKKIIVGSVLLLIPSYIFFAWIYVFNTFPEKSQAEKVVHYQSRFIPLSIDTVYLSLVGITVSVAAVVLLLKGSKEESGKAKIYGYALSAFAVALLLLLIWGVL